MRLEMLRTAKPELAGGRFYVVNNDAPGVGIYNPVFVGSGEQCGRFMDIAEHPQHNGLDDAARIALASDLARMEP